MTDSVEEERALLQAVAGGDQRALQSLYRRWQPRLQYYVQSRLGGDAAAAQDVVHEVMLDVWRQASRFEGRSKPLTWAMSMAHNKLVDYLRKWSREESHDSVPEPDDHDDGDTAAAIQGSQEAEYLHHCIRQLPDGQRDAIQLAFFDDMAYPDIAEVIDCPLGTVKTRIFHARAQLKRCLSALMKGLCSLDEPNGCTPRPS